MLAYTKLALESHLEYRFNSFVDWCLNPLISTIVEIAMWWTMFQAMGVTTLGGFSREYYLSYVTWSVFFARISANWMYEFRMLNEVESGSINSILVRPMNIYEYYLGQFMGYKLMTMIFSLWLPAIIALIIGGTTDFLRLPGAVFLVLVYLVFTYTLSFCIMTLSFRLTKVGSFTVTKNFFIWLASGELFPLDLLPAGMLKASLYLPFAAGCFVPVGFITHRLGYEDLMRSIYVTIFWTMILGAVGFLSWRRGLREYSGTGA